MTARCSVYIDAGYLLASCATRVTGTSLRSGIHVEFGKLIEGIRSQAEAITGQRVLRVHWYDSARFGQPDPQQQRIGELPRVKLRLGRFGLDGQQKGVDLRLGLDLVTHARNGAAESFLLVSGDDDFTMAVEEAQAQGVEVLLLAVPDSGGNAQAVSRFLRRAADDVHVIDGTLIDAAVIKVERPEPDDDDETAKGAEVSQAADPASSQDATSTSADPATTEPAETGDSTPEAPADADTGLTDPPLDSPDDTASSASSAELESQEQAKPKPVPRPRTPKDIAGHIRKPDVDGIPIPPDVIARAATWGSTFTPAVTDVVGRIIRSLALTSTTTKWQAVGLGRPSIPREVDRALLIDVSTAMGEVDLSDVERHEIRAAFWEAYDSLQDAIDNQ